MDPIDIALIGAGQWGRTYLKTLTTMEEVKIRWCCDSNPSIAPVLKDIYPQVCFTTRIDDVFEDPKVSGVVVATPPASHFSIAQQALEAGKNVLVEKPFTLSSPDANELVSLAESGKLVLMAGHIMEYHPAISWIKEFMGGGKLGRILYLCFNRTSFQTTRHQVNVLWDLAIHDLSILRYLLGIKPLLISGHGTCYLKPKVHDAVFLTIEYPDNILAQVHASWMYPLKSRVMTIVGEKRTLVFNELKNDQPICIYEHQETSTPLISAGKRDAQQQPCFLEHSLVPPDFRYTEPLRKQCLHFLECIRHGKEPLTGASDALRVIRMAEIAQKSMDRRGVPVPYHSGGY